MTRDCPFDGTPLTEDFGRDDSGDVRSVLRCACCEREYADLGEPWNPVEILTRVAAALEQERRGGL